MEDGELNRGQVLAEFSKAYGKIRELKEREEVLLSIIEELRKGLEEYVFGFAFKFNRENRGDYLFDSIRSSATAEKVLESTKSKLAALGVKVEE